MNHVPHPSDPNLVLVPHHHGRGYAVVNKAESASPPPGRVELTVTRTKITFGKIKYVGAALLLACLVSLSLSAYNLHEVRGLRDHITHVEKQVDDVGVCVREGQP